MASDKIIKYRVHINKDHLDTSYQHKCTQNTNAFFLKNALKTMNIFGYYSRKCV